MFRFGLLTIAWCSRRGAGAAPDWSFEATLTAWTLTLENGEGSLCGVWHESIDPLRDAIRRLHGAESRYVEAAAVHETFEGLSDDSPPKQTIWDGVVHVVNIDGHPTGVPIRHPMER
jgi:hypothetical protein